MLSPSSSQLKKIGIIQLTLGFLLLSIAILSFIYGQYHHSPNRDELSLFSLPILILSVPIGRLLAKGTNNIEESKSLNSTKP